MKKIKTIFDRDWEGTRKCIDKLIVDPIVLNACFATEKIDGTNVRVTVRNNEVVRLEKRRNPSKIQKKNGIVDPWYVDADVNNSSDKWLFDAMDNTELFDIPDGEWSAEAFGNNIQGNPLQLNGNRLFLFSCPPELTKIILHDVPTDYSGLIHYLSETTSRFNPKCNIEGIVWHNAHGNMFKIKSKDLIC